MITDTQIRNMADDEYLHYASLGEIPGIDSPEDDPVVREALSYNPDRLGPWKSRYALVDKCQAHASDMDKFMALQVLETALHWRL